MTESEDSGTSLRDCPSATFEPGVERTVNLSIPQTGFAERHDIEKVDQKMLHGLKVLVVEDHLVIAMDTESMLQDIGAAQIETAATAAEALDKLGGFNVDIAVLDVNLGSGTSLPVAEELYKRNIPFVIATGYGDTSMLPSVMANTPYVQKPYEPTALMAAITQALDRHKNAQSRT